MTLHTVYPMHSLQNLRGANILSADSHARKTVPSLLSDINDRPTSRYDAPQLCPGYIIKQRQHSIHSSTHPTFSLGASMSCIMFPTLPHSTCYITTSATVSTAIHHPNLRALLFASLEGPTDALHSCPDRSTGVPSRQAKLDDAHAMPFPPPPLTASFPSLRSPHAHISL